MSAHCSETPQKQKKQNKVKPKRNATATAKAFLHSSFPIFVTEVALAHSSSKFLPRESWIRTALCDFLVLWRDNDRHRLE